MKRLSNYQKFFEKKHLESILEEFSMILESDEAAAAAPTEVQSEKEILEEMPEDQKSKIEDILAKHFPESKGKLDVDNLKEGEGEKKEGEKVEKKEGEEAEKTNEGALLLAITIASLIPACMEAVGSISNLLKQKFSVNLDEKQIANLKKMNDAIATLNAVLSKGSGKFEGKEYNKKTFSEISNILSKELANPELAFGKGYDDHGHGKTNEEAEVATEEPKVEGDDTDKEFKEERLDPKYNKILDDTKKVVFGDKSSEDQIKKEISKLKKFRDKIFGSNFGNWMKEKGHSLHHAYTSPIRAVLWTISKATKQSSKLRDEQFREKVANVIYAVTMVGLAGYGIMSTLGHMAGVGEVAQIVLKGVEGGLNTKEIIKSAVTGLMGGAA
jgi:hypothetical protein